MMIFCFLLGLFSAFQQTADSTVSDTLVVFNPIDSTFSKRYMEFGFDASQTLFTTGHFTPEGRTVKHLALEIVDNEEQEYPFVDFKPIKDNDQKLYPLSAVVKLFQIRDDGTLGPRCSGMMVSKKHVLTAAHCVYYNEKLYRRVYAAAQYHKDYTENEFELSRAIKYHFHNKILQRGFLANDIALLELDKPLGIGNGWVGTGFVNKKENFLTDRVVHSFGFPGDTSLVDSTVSYDAEEMVHGYGSARFSYRQGTEIEIQNPAIPGQSGSSIFYTNNDEQYTSLGVMSLTTIEQTYFQPFDAFTFFSFKQVTDSLESYELASTVEIYQNYPNPFNPNTTIPFELFESQTISLTVYDVLGRKVATLIDNEFRNADFYLIPFNASGLSSGVYFYVLEGKQFRKTKKFTLIK